MHYLMIIEQYMGKKDPKQKEKCDAILYAMENKEMSMSQACRSIGVSPSTFLFWCEKDKELAERYARAKIVLAEVLADNLFKFADSPQLWVDVEEEDKDGNPVTSRRLIQVDHHRARLMYDARKWHLCKILPKYSEKIEISGNAENPLRIESKSTINVSSLSTQALAEIMAAKNDTD